MTPVTVGPKPKCSGLRIPLTVNSETGFRNSCNVFLLLHARVYVSGKNTVFMERPQSNFVFLALRSKSEGCLFSVEQGRCNCCKLKARVNVNFNVSKLSWRFKQLLARGCVILTRWLSRLICRGFTKHYKNILLK